MHYAQTSVALDLSWLTAHLYEEQFSIGAIAVAQACCAPVLQSTTEQWGCILTRPVLHCISVASLHTCMKSSIGAVAVTQACCEPVLQSTTEQWGMHLALSSAALHWC